MQLERRKEIEGIQPHLGRRKLLLGRAKQHLERAMQHLERSYNAAY